MPYAVKCWIEVPIEDMEDMETFETVRAVQSEYAHCKLMQPENHYEVVEVEKEEYPDGHIEWIEV